MSERPIPEIRDALERLRRRAVRVTFTGYLMRATFWALLVAALALALWPDALVELALVALAAGVLAAFVLTATRRPDVRALAKQYDDWAGWKDRLSSSVELQGEGDRPMVQALLEEARATAGEVDAEEALPLELPREGYLLPVPAILGVLVLLIVNAFSPPVIANPELEATIADQVARIEEFLSQERAKDPTPRRRELIERLEQLTQELTREPTDKKDALAQIAKLTQDLERDREEQEKQRLELRETIESFQKSEKTEQLAADLENGEWGEAMDRIQELIDELQREIDRKREAGELEGLEELEAQLRELEELQAKLMQLQLVDYDIDSNCQACEFLSECEGELGMCENPGFQDAKYLALGQCESEGQCDAAYRLERRLVDRASTKVGKSTIEEWYGEELRSDVDLEEEKIRIREGEGTSSVTQTRVANDGSRSRLAEREVLLAERRAAEDTIQRQDVPAGYRDYIRRYFDGMQPDQPLAGSGEAESDR